MKDSSKKTAEIFVSDLESYLRNPPYVKGVANEGAYHEGIKAQLYVYGFKKKLWPILESTPASFERNQRIDCVYCDPKTRKIVVALEIDRYIKKRSVEKLLSLDEDVLRIIISYGRSDETFFQARWRMNQYPNDIQIIRMRLYRPAGSKAL